MCGISGSISPLNKIHPFRSSDVFAHRGPDDEGFYQDGALVLEHRRLSILDLSANGHQPIVVGDDNFVMIYNGEIYNHQVLGDELATKGHTFFSTSDTETLIKGFMEKGADVLNHLNGIFAFAIYKAARELWLVRDQFGIKPLYYYADGKHFLFSSELKSLLSFSEFDKTIDEQALVFYLQLLYAPGEMTPFKKVRKTVAGSLSENFHKGEWQVGDDLFSGYRRHQAIQLEKYYAIMPRVVKRTVSYSIDHLPGNGSTVRRIKKLKTGLQFEKCDRLASYFYWQPTELVEALFAKKRQLLDGGESPASHFRNLLKNIPRENDDLNRMLYWELKAFLPDHNLNYTDKLSMAASVEARVPFLDKDLVQLSTSLPPHLKMHGKQTKYILKKVAEKYLPREVVYRQKTGFGAPIRKWVRFEMNEMIRERIHDSLLKNWNLFDAKAVEKLIEDTKNARFEGAYTVWSLLSIESWLRQFTR